MSELNYPHLFLTQPPAASDFTSPRSGRDNINFPDREDRRGHAQFIRQALNQVWAQSQGRSEERKAAALPTRSGTYIEFESAPDFDLRTKSLDIRQSGIRLLTVATRTDDEGSVSTFATVFVPTGKEAILLKKVEQFETEQTEKGQPKNEPLISSINSLKEAVLESFWRDDPTLLPAEREWCEAWLRYSEDAEEVFNEFAGVCAGLEIQVKTEYLQFPERAVALVLVSAGQMEELIASIDTLAEFRKAKATAGYWMGVENAELAEWANEFAARIELGSDIQTSVCLLDTGVNNGHVMLNPVLSDEDCHTINPDWGTSDAYGHGTLMCGVAAFGGEIDTLLQSTHQIQVPYILESVKLIPEPGLHHNEELYGLRTKQAISRARIDKPDLGRVVCLSITSEDFRDEGRPSSWSGSVDQICSGAEDERRQLVLVSAGNIRDPGEWRSYPASNTTQAVHDPGQAWNALTVGAFTQKTEIEQENLAARYTPIARSGELSPFSCTSNLWDKKWPNKPDIVMEGGNAGIDSTGFTTEIDDLSILSTNNNPQQSQFCPINATSAAAGLAAHMAGHLSAQYPNAWPETIRALMVHSASWTEGLVSQFSSTDRTQKSNQAVLLRSCGYGVPDFSAALESAQDSLTLITEQEIQPFQRKENASGYETKDMHLIRLPWPLEALAELPGETAVRIDVTLSYFVEPGPGEIGWRDKYRYRSHGLDFELKGPTEEDDDFLRRLNKAAREDEMNDAGGSPIGWAIGANTRNRGSIHRDWWETTAAAASSCNVIGVFPRSGWWKERHHLGKGGSSTRYSLVVSLKTPGQTVDIYTPVANEIAAQVEITTN